MDLLIPVFFRGKVWKKEGVSVIGGFELKTIDMQTKTLTIELWTPLMDILNILKSNNFNSNVGSIYILIKVRNLSNFISLRT